MTRLRFSRVNSAWLFMFGDAPLQLHGAPMFFETKGAALDAADDLGLAVDGAGNVSVAVTGESAGGAK